MSAKLPIFASKWEWYCILNGLGIPSKHGDMWFCCVVNCAYRDINLHTYYRKVHVDMVVVVNMKGRTLDCPGTVCCPWSIDHSRSIRFLRIILIQSHIQFTLFVKSITIKHAIAILYWIRPHVEVRPQYKYIGLALGERNIYQCGWMLVVVELIVAWCLNH